MSTISSPSTNVAPRGEKPGFINEISGPGREINIHHLQEIVMEFVCLELVPMKEPPNPFHHQPSKIIVITIIHFYYIVYTAVDVYCMYCYCIYFYCSLEGEGEDVYCIYCYCIYLLPKNLTSLLSSHTKPPLNQIQGVIFYSPVFRFLLRAEKQTKPNQIFIQTQASDTH